MSSSVGFVNDQICWQRISKIPPANGKQGPATLTNKIILTKYTQIEQLGRVGFALHARKYKYFLYEEGASRKI
jgi:hypothetical protein